MCVFECFLVVPLQTLTRAMALVVLFTARSQCRPSSVSHECGKGRKPGSKLAFSEDSMGSGASDFASLLKTWVFFQDMWLAHRRYYVPKAAWGSSGQGMLLTFCKND